MPIQWKITYKDGSKEDGIDNLSKRAYNNPTIKFFRLSIESNSIFIDLSNGVIDINGFKIFSPFEKAFYRLVFYKVVGMSIGASPLQNIEREETVYFGWQTNINNKNYKLILGITPDNRIIINSEMMREK